MLAIRPEPVAQDVPDLRQMADLLADARIAARSLYELHAAPETVEPLYRYLSDALSTVGAGIADLVATACRGNAV